MLILLVVLILLFGFGGYRMGPGFGYYGGGGLSLIRPKGTSKPKTSCLPHTQEPRERLL